MIRPATINDLEAMVVLAERFIGETNYEVEFDAEKSRHHLAFYLLMPNLKILVADENGIVGGAMMAVSHEFQKRPFGYVSKFFVAPEARNWGIGRSLIEATIAWLKEQGVSHIFSTATAGLDEMNQRLFVNLLKKYGFRDCGPVMCMEV